MAWCARRFLCQHNNGWITIREAVEDVGITAIFSVFSDFSQDQKNLCMMIDFLKRVYGYDIMAI